MDDYKTIRSAVESAIWRVIGRVAFWLVALAAIAGVAIWVWRVAGSDAFNYGP